MEELMKHLLSIIVGLHLCAGTSLIARHLMFANFAPRDVMVQVGLMPIVPQQQGRAQITKTLQEVGLNNLLYTDAFTVPAKKDGMASTVYIMSQSRRESPSIFMMSPIKVGFMKYYLKFTALYEVPENDFTALMSNPSEINSYVA